MGRAERRWLYPSIKSPEWDVHHGKNDQGSRQACHPGGPSGAEMAIT